MTTAVPPLTSRAAAVRIQSIDLLRGAVMIVMALDHLRDFVHYGAGHFRPDDLTHTTAALFFTRWVTHFCAPVFMFTAGLGAFLRAQRVRDKGDMSTFLLTRGFEAPPPRSVARIPLMPFVLVYGSIDGMELKIDKSGRIVVPKPLRERLGLKPDVPLQAIEQQDGVLLKRVEARASMTKIDGLWVHQGIPQPGAKWERILDDSREERLDSVLKT